MKNINFLYMKMLLFYSFILLLIIIGLEGLFVYQIRQQNREACMYSQQQMCRKASAEIQEMLGSSQDLINNVYGDEIQLTDLTDYLYYDPETYIKKRLDVYSQSNYTVYSGRARFINYGLESVSELVEIRLVSYKNHTETQYFKNMDVFVRSMEHKPLAENRKVCVENEQLLVRKLVSNGQTQEPLGEICFVYGTDSLEEIYQEAAQGTLQAITEDGAVLYASENGEEWTGAANQYYQTVAMEAGELTVRSYIKRKDAERLGGNALAFFLLSGILLFVFGEVLVHWYLKRFERRISGILDAMEKIRQGDLDVELSCGREELIFGKRLDELDLIAENLDAMCKDLKRYIDRSYVAEIAQKRAEMEAIQNQINPHFLYNTLEAIRMNSLECGDRASAKMLYNLAVIFRSQIKERRLIPLAKELHYGKKYMELYEFRHPGRFRFSIFCPEELLQYAVLKFSVQPMIENYFVHGIRAMEEDNWIKISVSEVSDGFLVTVADNGLGMGPEALARKNRELFKERPSGDSSDSIGLMNVQRRIRAEFGLEYGIVLKLPEGGRGLEVCMRLPKREISKEDKDV